MVYLLLWTCLFDSTLQVIEFYFKLRGIYFRLKVISTGGVAIIPCYIFMQKKNMKKFVLLLSRFQYVKIIAHEMIRMLQRLAV